MKIISPLYRLRAFALASQDLVFSGQRFSVAGRLNWKKAAEYVKNYVSFLISGGVSFAN